MTHYKDLSKEDKNAYKERQKIYYQANRERIIAMYKKWREANPDYFKRKVYTKEERHERNKKRANRRKSLMINLKKGKQCEKCGYRAYPQILHFHHKGSDKKKDVSSCRSLREIEEEVKKCILLCPNCHAEEHTRG